MDTMIYTNVRYLIDRTQAEQTPCQIDQTDTSGLKNRKNTWLESDTLIKYTFQKRVSQ